MFVGLRSVAVVGLCVAVSAGAGSGVVARQPYLADVDPHEGVARAHAMPVQGIDVSNWQGDIDWNKVRAAGTQFAFIKATEGGDYVDPKFAQNWQAAKSVGIPRGAYHCVYWCRAAHEQALWFILNVPNDPDALPPVLDLEWNGHSRGLPETNPVKLALEKIKIMLEVMEAHTGKRPIIYTDVRSSRARFWKASCQATISGCARSPAEPQEIYRDRPWLFWQFTTTGYVPGIEKPVDRNVFNGTFGDWRQVLPARAPAKQSVRNAN